MEKYQAILPPSHHGIDKPYKPPCPRYESYPPGEITRFSRDYLVGTCSPNFDGTSDFFCRMGAYAWHCRDSTGRLRGPSPNSICCYGERKRRPFPVRSRSVPPFCCSQDLEGCAQCATYSQGYDQSNKRAQRRNMYECARCVQLSQQERALLRT